MNELAVRIAEARPLRVVARLRNNRMILAREALGFLHASTFAEAHGLRYGSYVELEGLRRSPWGEDGEFTELAQKIAIALKVHPEVLWPPELAAVKQTSTIRAIDVPGACLPDAPASPLELLERNERLVGLESVIDDLSPMRQTIIRARFGLDDGHEHTLDEIGELVHLSRERIRQIIIRTLAWVRERIAAKDDRVPSLRKAPLPSCEPNPVHDRHYYVVDVENRRAYRLSSSWLWNDLRVHRVIVVRRACTNRVFSAAIHRALNLAVEKYGSRLGERGAHVKFDSTHLHTWLADAGADVRVLSAQDTWLSGAGTDVRVLPDEKFWNLEEDLRERVERNRSARGKTARTGDFAITQPSQE